MLGAHSTSNQFNFDTSAGKVGAPQDSTPGFWDVRYYNETLNPPEGIVVLPSDAKLARYGDVGALFKVYADNPVKWSIDFLEAMGKLVMFGRGGDTTNMANCTGVLPQPIRLHRPTNKTTSGNGL